MEKFLLKISLISENHYYYYYFLEIVSTYSNEIIHIHICMKLERHKDSILVFLKTQRFQKTLLKKNLRDFIFSFDILRSKRTFQNIATCTKCFIFLKFWFGINF
jgi:hypothetical protein